MHPIVITIQNLLKQKFHLNGKNFTSQPTPRKAANRRSRAALSRGRARDTTADRSRREISRRFDSRRRAAYRLEFEPRPIFTRPPACFSDSICPLPLSPSRLFARRERISRDCLPRLLEISRTSRRRWRIGKSDFSPRVFLLEQRKGRDAAQRAGSVSAADCAILFE